MFTHASKPLIALTLALLAATIAAILAAPESVVSLLRGTYGFLTTSLAWLFLLLGVVFAILAVLAMTTRWGDIRMGGRDAKPEYSTFTWIAMNICNALAAGILIFGTVEWMFYVNTPPFGLEPGSVEAYEYASAYGMFHWGFSAWAFYLIPGLAIGYLYWNKGAASLRMSDLARPLIGSGETFASRSAGFLLDAIVVFGYFAAIMTTVGIGTPVMGEILSDVFGIENSFALKLGVIIVFCTFFTLSASKSIARGMGRISDFNVKLGLAFFAFLLIAGDTGFMLNNTVMAIGTNIREFVRMSFNSDAIGNSGFVQSWTIFYWAWYVAIAFLCANWIARTSYGRTFREIAVSNCIWAPLACWLSFSTLGNYGMGQELFHGLEVSSAINEVGSAGATLMVLQTLPFPKVAALVFLVLVFFNLATSATGSGLALSLYTAKGLGPRDEPDRRLTIFWCVLFLVMPVGILLLERAIPGLNVLSTIQSMITVSSIPVFFVLMALFIAFIRVIRSDIRSGAVAKAVSPSRAWRWTDDALPPEAARPASEPAKPQA
ncbi:BCCT family transporter [uncultured Sutterella sp.]|uniref:BCCT family transporter n=1 Tax=uncultured Sutterella sp. TaxID=286133 RepID=UPI002608280C|nr:BCCT family transporter [uncultured Sutterella sp.]